MSDLVLDNFGRALVFDRVTGEVHSWPVPTAQENIARGGDRYVHGTTGTRIKAATEAKADEPSIAMREEGTLDLPSDGPVVMSRLDPEPAAPRAPPPPGTALETETLRVPPLPEPVVASRAEEGARATVHVEVEPAVVDPDQPARNDPADLDPAQGERKEAVVHGPSETATVAEPGLAADLGPAPAVVVDADGDGHHDDNGRFVSPQPKPRPRRPARRTKRKA